MTDIGKTPTNITFNIVQAKDCVVNITCVDASNNPFDVSAYEFYFVVRANKNSNSTKIFEILNANIAQSDSGSGTTDTITLDITNSLSNVTIGKYHYELVGKKISSGDNEVWFQGILNVQWTLHEAL